MVGPEVCGGVKIERRRDGRLVGGGGGCTSADCKLSRTWFAVAIHLEGAMAGAGELES